MDKIVVLVQLAFAAEVYAEELLAKTVDNLTNESAHWVQNSRCDFASKLVQFSIDRLFSLGLKHSHVVRDLDDMTIGSSGDLEDEIKSLGDEIRTLKASGVDKETLKTSIDQLLALKAKRTTTTAEPSKIDKEKTTIDTKFETKAITRRSENYPQWYHDVIAAGELVANSPVRGCMVIRPAGMAIWEALRDDLDRRIKQTGTQNAYFPIFIPQSFLEREADHVDGFAKECALVTHSRLRATPNGTGLEPDPASKLAEPLVVRPTSETMIWYMFKDWIQSHRDLPLKINQWANVVRWERSTRPFLRTSEFLWQEGHTAHATADEAKSTAKEMLDIYADVAESFLSIPVLKGVKSENERFAGADDTFTIEAMMQNGMALQSGTSHFLGQSFAKAFDVTYMTDDEMTEPQLVWATSWGVSTRLLGALIMTHSDDKGLVLPPTVAQIQVVIITIFKASDPEEEIQKYANRLADQLRAGGIRVHVDNRKHVTPGTKFYQYERKGVPLRLEVGPMELKKGSAYACSRHDGKKFSINVTDGKNDLLDVVTSVQNVFAKIQTDLFENAKRRADEKTFRVSTYQEMKDKLDKAEYGFFVVPWAANNNNEDSIKAETGATLRCYPFDLQSEAQAKNCFYSGKPATHMAVFAKAY